MTTGLVSVIYTRLMRLEEGEEKTIVLQTGSKIRLGIVDSEVYIYFQSKNLNIRRLQFKSFKYDPITGKAYAVLRALSNFADFYEAYLDRFQYLLNCKIKKRSERAYYDGGWIFDDSFVVYVFDKKHIIKAFCDCWERGREDLLEFFKEITDVTLGYELNEDLSLARRIR